MLLESGIEKRYCRSGQHIVNNSRSELHVGTTLRLSCTRQSIVTYTRSLPSYLLLKLSQRIASQPSSYYFDISRTSILSTYLSLTLVMADSIQLQSDHDEFNTLMKDMHDSLRVSFSKPTQIEACSETYFDTSELDSFGLFNGDLRTVEQLPEETLSGLPFRAPTSSSSSSSNPSIAYQSDVSKQVASTDLRESAYTLPFRPADVPQWRFEQPQHHVQRALPPFDMTPLGTTYMGPNGLLIQTPSTTPSPEPTYSVDHDQSLGEDLNLPTYNPWEMNVPFNASGFPHPATKQSMDEDTATDGDDEPINIVDGIDLSYAKELERCLRRMPEYTLPLKDIYAWIKENTNKVKDPQSRGWQNSVRHNLSLNEVSRTFYIMTTLHITDCSRGLKRCRYLAKAPKGAVQAFGDSHVKLLSMEFSPLPSSGKKRRTSPVARTKARRLSGKHPARKADLQLARTTGKESSKRG